MKTKLRRVLALTVCGLVCVAFFVNLCIKLWPATRIGIEDVDVEVEEAEVALPVMKITLSDVTLTEIHENSKDIKYGGNTLNLTVSGKTTEYPEVEIKGRGNSTWTQPKRPYQIKFQSKVGFLGMDKAKKWVLLANTLDASELRNDIAFYLERMLEARYALTGEFVELHIDGENLGVYFATPKMEIDKNRIDLRDPMGILVEIDNLHTSKEECYWSGQGSCLIISDVVTDDLAEMAMESFVGQFNILEEAAKKGDYQTVTEVADVESLAKYYLLEEFTVNPDAYNTSYYFYRDGADDKIHAGPGWDFDYALGNRMWQWEYLEDFHSPTQTQVERKLAFGGELHNKETGELIKHPGSLTISRIIYYLMDIPEFQRLVRETFVGKMQGKKEQLLTYIKARVEVMGDVISQDDERWERDNFGEEMEYLLWWVETRYGYFEQEYGA